MSSQSIGAEPQRQPEIAKRRTDATAFDGKATPHFQQNQRRGNEAEQHEERVRLSADLMRAVRRHLHDIRSRLGSGNFSRPAHILGDGMPDLPKPPPAKLGEISITFHVVAGGTSQLLSKGASPANLQPAIVPGWVPGAVDCWC